MQGRECRAQTKAALQFGLELDKRDVGRRLDDLHEVVLVPGQAGGRWPPTCAGAALPVSRTRRISLIAAEALTSKRRAASRIELPPSTARTIRSRKSIDIGAGIPNPPATQPIVSNHRYPFYAIGKSLVGSFSRIRLRIGHSLTSHKLPVYCIG